jgi:hypothetical protein
VATKPAETRDTLQRLADHARWHANGLFEDAAAHRLLTYAQGLETRAGDISEGLTRDSHSHICRGPISVFSGGMTCRLEPSRSNYSAGLKSFQQ